MAKKLTFKFEDENYTLEFNKKVVKQLEGIGFSIDKVSSQPMTAVPLLFEAAFIMHQPKIKTETVRRIYACLDNKTELLQWLIQMYNDPIDALMDEPEDEAKKVSWVKEQ